MIQNFARILCQSPENKKAPCCVQKALFVARTGLYDSRIIAFISGRYKKLKILVTQWLQVFDFKHEQLCNRYLQGIGDLFQC